MIKRLILYVTSILIILYCFFIFDDAVVAVILVMETLYLLLSLVLIIISRFKVDISLGEIMPIADKNQKIFIPVLMENKSKFFTVNYSIVIKVENAFTGEKAKYNINGKINRKSKLNEKITIVSKECGHLDITLDRVYLYDILYILRTTIKKSVTKTVGIMPQYRLIPIEITRKTRDFIADADEYSENESGDDPSEIYQIREYRQQDPIHDIHWKLSAKADELLVKEHGRPLASAVLVWLDFADTNGEKMKRIIKKNNKVKNKKIYIPSEILDLVASISVSLVNEKCVHTVAWYEPQNDKIKRKRVSKEKNMYELLNHLLYLRPYKNSKQAGAQFDDAFKGVNFSTIVEVRLDGTVKVGDEIINVTEKNKIKWENLYFKV